MRISDWSSDVCSSDLLHRGEGEADAILGEGLLDHRVGLAPDHELLAGPGHHLHADLDGEIAEMLNPLHLQGLDDVRRKLRVLRQLLEIGRAPSELESQMRNSNGG